MFQNFNEIGVRLSILHRINLNKGNEKRSTKGENGRKKNGFVNAVVFYMNHILIFSTTKTKKREKEEPF